MRGQERGKASIRARAHLWRGGGRGAPRVGPLPGSSHLPLAPSAGVMREMSTEAIARSPTEKLPY